jgi:hypothetical protein
LDAVTFFITIRELSMDNPFIDTFIGMFPDVFFQKLLGSEVVEVAKDRAALSPVKTFPERGTAPGH